VESKDPPGSKPPSQPEAPKPQETAWISPRLREKLMEAESHEPKRSSPLPGILFAALLIGGGILGFVVYRSNAAKHKAEELQRARAAADSAAAAAAAAARADSMRLAAADTSASRSAAKPARAGAAPGASKPAGGAPPHTATASASGSGATSTTKPAATSGATSTTKPAATSGAATGAAAPAPAAAKGPYGIDVGSFLFEERAKAEQERLAGATGLAGRVVTKTTDGESSYHAVLGSFETRGAAQKKAESLVAKGLVNEIHIVSLSQ